MALCISLVTLRKGNAVVHVPCGKCNQCLQNRRADWSFRLWNEMKVSTSAWFITITYDGKHQPTIPFEDYQLPTLDKEDVQKFMKRLRKHNDATTTRLGKARTTLKYYLVGEYGGKSFRPHYHIILFNLEPDTLNEIPSIWGLGHVSVGTCEPASIHYTTKYVLNKKDGWAPIAPPFSLISNGIGKHYLRTNGHEHKKALQNFVVGNNGQKLRLPRYYKEAIFSIREKETLAAQSIDQYDVLYRKAIERLSQVHPQPENYHDYLRRYHNDRITSKNDLTTSKTI